MRQPRPILPLITPTVVEAFDRFDSDFPALWFEFDVGESCHWKQGDIWRVYVGLRRWLGDPECRCYVVRARKRSTALEKVMAAIASIYPMTVTLYRVSAPMSRATIAAIETFNARFARATWRKESA